MRIRIAVAVAVVVVVMVVVAYIYAMDTNEPQKIPAGMVISGQCLVQIQVHLNDCTHHKSVYLCNHTMPSFQILYTCSLTKFSILVLP